MRIVCVDNATHTHTSTNTNARAKHFLRILDMCASVCHAGTMMDHRNQRILSAAYGDKPYVRLAFLPAVFAQVVATALCIAGTLF